MRSGNLAARGFEVGGEITAIVWKYNRFAARVPALLRDLDPPEGVQELWQLLKSSKGARARGNPSRHSVPGARDSSL